jgi:hypothetical protein
MVLVPPPLSTSSHPPLRWCGWTPTMSTSRDPCSWDLTVRLAQDPCTGSGIQTGSLLVLPFSTAPDVLIIESNLQWDFHWLCHNTVGPVVMGWYWESLFAPSTLWSHTQAITCKKQASPDRDAAGAWSWTSQPPRLWAVNLCCLYITQSKVSYCSSLKGLRHTPAPLVILQRRTSKCLPLCAWLTDECLEPGGRSPSVGTVTLQIEIYIFISGSSLSPSGHILILTALRWSPKQTLDSWQVWRSMALPEELSSRPKTLGSDCLS